MSSSMDLSTIKFNLSTSLFEAKDYKKALEEILIAVENNSNEDKYYILLCKIYRKLGVMDKALEAVHRAIAIDPTQALYYSERYHTYMYLGMIEKALVDCEKAIELKPTDAQLYYNNAMCFATLCQYNTRDPLSNVFRFMEALTVINYALSILSIACDKNAYIKLKLYIIHHLKQLCLNFLEFMMYDAVMIMCHKVFSLREFETALFFVQNGLKVDPDNTEFYQFKLKLQNVSGKVNNVPNSNSSPLNSSDSNNENAETKDADVSSVTEVGCQ
jgi:tetratricopeptide (TPR) repeat protein